MNGFRFNNSTINFMKRKSLFSSLLLATVLCFTACEDEANNSGDIIVEQNGQLTQSVLANEITGQSRVDFKTMGAWSSTIKETGASTSPDWISITPDSGDKAGDYSVTINLSENFTGNERKATITIFCGNDKITVTLTQKGTTEDGEVPENPKLITKIVETASFNSDYYNATRPYAPYFYEFKYDQQNRLKEYIVKEHDGEEYSTCIYSYDIQGEVRIGDRWGEYITAPLNANGYLKEINIGYSSYDKTYTYNSEGYLNKITPAELYQRSVYEFIWDNGNPVHIKGIEYKYEYESKYNPKTNEYEDKYEWVETDYDNNDITSTFSSELNNKTTIDLNAFFFGLTGVRYRYEYYSGDDLEYFSALIGLIGKRAKNYMTSKNGGDSVGLNSEMVVHTEATVPAVGTIIWTYYSDSFYGKGSYTFDSDGYPTAFSHQVEMEKTVSVYNGKREYIDIDERDKQWLEEEYGPGPWFYISTDYTTTKSYDTYTYRISYNR